MKFGRKSVGFFGIRRNLENFMEILKNSQKYREIQEIKKKLLVILKMIGNLEKYKKISKIDEKVEEKKLTVTLSKTHG